jgi:hypothetical protein
MKLLNRFRRYDVHCKIIDYSVEIKNTRNIPKIAYRVKDGSIKPAKNLLEAIKSAEPDYYLLGVNCSTGTIPAGYSLHMGTDIISTLKRYFSRLTNEKTGLIAEKRLIKKFYDGIYESYVLVPADKQLYDAWIESYAKPETSTEDYEPLPSFVIYDNIAKLIQNHCDVCLASVKLS